MDLTDWERNNIASIVRTEHGVREVNFVREVDAGLPLRYPSEADPDAVPYYTAHIDRSGKEWRIARITPEPPSSQTSRIPPQGRPSTPHRRMGT